MNRLDMITFLSDFGWSGGYVAACEAVVARVRPHARVSHISHWVPVGDIAAGAITLARVVPFYPVAVHLAIVDPGVGTGRRPLALVTGRGDFLVGPDNGLLMPAADVLGGAATAWHIDPERVRVQAGLPAGSVSSTFHGRDVFAPAAALLSAGVEPAEFAAGADLQTLVRLTPPLADMTPDGAIAHVIEVDRFGNVGLALPFAALRPREGEFVVEVVGEDLPEWSARVIRTYSDLRSGELGLYCDSWGQVALALNGASAAQLLSIEQGMTVQLTVAKSALPAGQRE